MIIHMIHRISLSYEGLEMLGRKSDAYRIKESSGVLKKSYEEIKEA